MLKLDPNTHKHADIINGIYNATEKVFIDTCHISENDPNFDQMFAEVWRNTVEVIAEEQTTGDNWRTAQVGQFFKLSDCGLKVCGRTIKAPLDEVYYSTKDGDELRRCMVVIEEIVEMSDDDLLCFDFDHKPEGAHGGGVLIENKTYTGFSLVTLLRSKNYCIFVNCEGYDYCRYCLYWPNYRDMYGDILEDMKRKEDEQKAAEMVEQLKEEMRHQAAARATVNKWSGILKDVSDMPENKQSRHVSSNVKKYLSETFGDHGFRVSCKYAKYYFQAGCSCSISWTNGPTKDEVREAVEIFQGIIDNSDPMTDYYEVHEDPDNQFCKKFGYIERYVDLTRNYTGEIYEQIKKDVDELISEVETTADGNFNSREDRERAIDLVNRATCGSIHNSNMAPWTVGDIYNAVLSSYTL